MKFNMRFSRDKCQVLNLGWHNPKQEHQLALAGWTVAVLKRQRVSWQAARGT